MKLNYDSIKSITTGAARVCEEQESVKFYRFTEEQELAYKERKDSFYIKTFSSAGIKLCFKTDSKTLFLKVFTSPGSSRSYFSYDVFADGNLVGSLDNFSNMELLPDYTTDEYPLGEFSKRFDLGDGVKTVTVYLPWSVVTVLDELSIDDGAFVEPVKSSKKLLMFGDSITHGYDAMRPYNRYGAKLAKLMGADEYNKGIGGERFFPGLAELKEDFVPDYITVAYGTNDWSNVSYEEFVATCKPFYEALSKKYPESKIFSISPIWRKDHMEERDFGKFETVEEIIESIVSEFENITLVSGFDLVPHDEMYYGDLRLHPNDNGFDCYSKNLYNKIKKYI